MLKLFTTFVVAIVLWGSFAAPPARAQNSVVLCVRNANGGCTPVDANAPLAVTGIATYPAGATALTGNATGTTGAVAGSLGAASGKTTYICGFSVSAIGGTAAVGPIVIAGTITASLTYNLASTVAGNTLSTTFSPCIPASATNTAITTTTTADGTASAVAVNSWGFRL